MFFVDSTKSEEFLRFKDKHSAVNGSKTAGTSSGKRRSSRSFPAEATSKTDFKMDDSVLNESKRTSDMDDKPDDTLTVVSQPATDFSVSTPYASNSNNHSIVDEFREAPSLEERFDSKSNHEDISGRSPLDFNGTFIITSRFIK